MSNRWITIGSVFLALVSLSILAAEKHSGHTPSMDHSAMSDNSEGPTEGGQSTYAALIEIVALLENDNDTQWENVDIDGLRTHLLDMNHLILNTTATKTLVNDNLVRFDVTGSAESIPSIHRMVPAHSRFIEESRGWAIKPELTDTGASLAITTKDTQTLKRLDALGFYGFMSLDSHHQAHHYQMALGNTH